MWKCATVVCLLWLVPFAAAQKKRTPVPASVTEARYVAIVPLNDSQRADWFNDANVDTGDRELADAVLSALHSWGKYKYTIDPKNADIIIAVRSGRPQASEPTLQAGGMRVGGTRTRSSSALQPSMALNSPSATAKPAEDALAVFMGNDASGAPIWIHQQKSGLRGKLPLFEQFRKDVEKSEKTLAEKKQ